MRLGLALVWLPGALALVAVTSPSHGGSGVTRGSPRLWERRGSRQVGRQSADCSEDGLGPAAARPRRGKAKRMPPAPVEYPAGSTVWSATPLPEGVTATRAFPERPGIPSADTGMSTRLRQVSTWAAVLCTIDCVALPLLAGVQTLAVIPELHKIGHVLALYVVIPVASVTSALSFVQHRSNLIFSMGILGIVLTWTTHVKGFCGHSSLQLVACAFLLGSQWWSQQRISELQGCCDGCFPMKLLALFAGSSSSNGSSSGKTGLTSSAVRLLTEVKGGRTGNTRI